MMHSGEPIREFRGEWRFLSNFYIEPDGTHVEGEYQAQKCCVAQHRDGTASRLVRMTPAQAKRAGRKVVLRPDWESVKIETMRMLVWQKFVDHPGLADKLLQTGNRELVEGNWWGDRFWGKVDNGNGAGENWLGRILMETREKFRNPVRIPVGVMTLEVE